MDERDTIAPAPSESRNPARIPSPRRHGLCHENSRHTTHFTVIGNHLAQHQELSLLAIGLGCHIQSLPQGAKVDIKSLAARFPEGTTRIAAALRELEKHGYLRRSRERTPEGRMVTRTTSCNRPGHPVQRGEQRDRPPPPPRPRESREPREPRKRALPPVPQPSCTAPALLRSAADLLSGLRREDPRLLLSASDTAHLAPGVAAWLERDVSATGVRQALTSGLPAEPLHRPAALLAHRLSAGLPPPPPFTAPPPARLPLQTCDGCERAFRAPAPGRCRDCRAPSGEHTAAYADGGPPGRTP
ncbi:helix-turn-helix domain-containing protein [Streptomyces sp. NPDC004610]|uniref:helix-turn-helix domain-containing protein n=1 Tax=unclassified Streptomyces TaxID=2593676 RepID=UPI0033B2E87F